MKLGHYINRVEVIDHTKGGKGRVYVKWEEEPIEITLDIQDDGKTLKIFFTDDNLLEANEGLSTTGDKRR